MNPNTRTTEQTAREVAHAFNPMISSQCAGDSLYVLRHITEQWGFAMATVLRAEACDYADTRDGSWVTLSMMRVLAAALRFEEGSV